MDKLTRHLEYLKNNPMKIGFIYLFYPDDRKRFHLFLESVSIKKTSMSIKKFPINKITKTACDKCHRSIILQHHNGYMDGNYDESYDGDCNHCGNSFYNEPNDWVSSIPIIHLKNNAIAYGDFFRGYHNRPCKDLFEYNDIHELLMKNKLYTMDAPMSIFQSGRRELIRLNKKELYGYMNHTEYVEFV